MNEKKDTLKIHKISADNIYKLKHVEMELTEKGLVSIGGSNDQGKSSLFNAIRIALSGKSESGSKPIRDGEENGEITLECGDFTIKRKITDKGISLKVSSKDGKQTYKSPQALLDSFKSNLAFRPDKFMSMDKKEQVKTLMEITGLDFTELDKKKSNLYEERKIVNRRCKDLEALTTISHEKNYENPLLPNEEIVISKLLQELKEIMDYNESVKNNKKKLSDLIDEHDTIKNQIHSLTERLKQNEKERNEINRNELEEKPTQYINEQISTAESVNVKIRKKQEHNELVKKYLEAKKESENLTKNLKETEDERTRRISESPLPIKNLTFNENGVFYKEIPFEQLSHSEKLKISVIFGMAINPKLRLILIEDASLFDNKSLQTIANLANKNDYQILAEIVTKNDTEENQCSFIIENGEVKK